MAGFLHSVMLSGQGQQQLPFQPEASNLRCCGFNHHLGMRSSDQDLPPAHRFEVQVDRAVPLSSQRSCQGIPGGPWIHVDTCNADESPYTALPGAEGSTGASRAQSAWHCWRHKAVQHCSIWTAHCLQPDAFSAS